MGYETTLIIGTKLPWIDKEAGRGIIEIARIDLCKSFFYSTILKEDKSIHEPLHIYEGDKKVRFDCYGDPLLSNDPQVVLEIMERENKKLGYRRYNAAIPMLKSLIQDFSSEDLTCILYGH